MASDDLYSTADDPATVRVLSVGELTSRIKGVLEGQFPSVWVSGEISNFSRPQSGHCYFTLKDDQAQIRGVMWRAAASRVRCELHDGLEVICQGYLDVYAPRGSYQLVIQQVEPKGLGALERALRQLRERLAAEGLFDPSRKRPLPRFPRRIAFVTSPTGAAIRDFLEVLRRRWRGVDVLIVPVRVQGDGAAAEIAAGIQLANRLEHSIDVLVVGRGGGSLEDLWAFNEEIVVRAIHASRIPVVSAVGHEIDVTLADLVADVRALTPSEAAERVAPAADEITAFLRRQEQRLATALRSRAGTARARLESLAERRVFRRPLERVQVLARQLDELQARALRAILRRREIGRGLLDAQAGRLASLSPLAVLARGYSLTMLLDEISSKDAPDNSAEQVRSAELVRSVRQLSAGQRLLTRVSDGEITSRVEQIRPTADGTGAGKERL